MHSAGFVASEGRAQEHVAVGVFAVLAGELAGGFSPLCWRFHRPARHSSRQGGQEGEEAGSRNAGRARRTVFFDWPGELSAQSDVDRAQ
eukprot:8144782-Alexandrium_andersonii.AAC.1